MSKTDRYRLVHDYEGTNWTLLAQIVESDLPEFLRRVDCLLSNR